MGLLAAGGRLLERLDLDDLRLVQLGEALDRRVERGLFPPSQGGLTPDDFALASKLARVGVAVSPKGAKENPERGAAEKRAMGNDT